MDNRLIWPFRWLTKRFLSHIPYASQDAEKIRSLTEAGSVVFIHRSRSVIYHLALKQSLHEQQIPEPLETRGIGTDFLRSWFSFFSQSRKTEERAEQLKKCIENKIPCELFLKKPLTLFNRKRGYKTNYVEQLVHIQKEIDHPIYLVPLFFVPRVNPQKSGGKASNLLFGTTREPGFLRALTRIALSGKQARWEVAEILDLSQYISESKEITTNAMTKNIRWELLGRISRLEHQYCGPPLKTFERIQMNTLRERSLSLFIDKLSEQTGIEKEKVQKKAQGYVKEIAARFDVDMIRLMDVSFRFIFGRLFEGIQWDKNDIDKIREAAKHGPLVIVPGHRSHMDYLVMSSLLYQEGIMPPHIAAGDNLSFFPLGQIFRKGGAYFIRRSFKGDPLYPQVVKAYISRLFKEEYCQEFFIEGTRSRSGKTLWPKLGLLSIMLDALLQKPKKEAIFIPANIAYEKLIESGTYQKELEGAEKEKESNLELVKSAKLLKKRYGKVFVTFDEPIYLSRFLKNKGLENSAEASIEKISRSLGYHIAHGISQSAIITPTALMVCALFGSHRRILAEPELAEAISKLAHHIKKNSPHQARFSTDTFDFYSDNFKKPLHMLLDDDAISKEALDDTIYYRINEQKAFVLDFYKNTIVNHFAAEAILATAFVTLNGWKGKAVKLDDLKRVTKTLSDVFQFEFIYPPNMNFDQTFNKTLQSAIDDKLLSKDADTLTLIRSKESANQIKFATRMLANFVDAYMVAFKKTKVFTKEKITKKDLSKKLLKVIRAHYLSGKVEHPESASKAIVDNFIHYLIHKGAIHFSDDRAKIATYNKAVALKVERETLKRSHFNRLLI